LLSQYTHLSFCSVTCLPFDANPLALKNNVSETKVIYPTISISVKAVRQLYTKIHGVGKDTRTVYYAKPKKQ